MKIFFDQGTPAPLRRALRGHTVSTAHEMGWGELDNGELLAAAEAEFDLLVTTDKNLRHQQNLTGRRLAIVILPTTS
jgi:predicted nuclease of predicted toxin-antitoxin system